MLIGVSGRMTWQPGQNGLEAGTVGGLGRGHRVRESHGRMQDAF